MELNNENKDKFPVPSIRQRVTTKASSKITNCPFQFIFFRETKRIKSPRNKKHNNFSVTSVFKPSVISSEDCLNSSQMDRDQEENLAIKNVFSPRTRIKRTSKDSLETASFNNSNCKSINQETNTETLFSDQLSNQQIENKEPCLLIADEISIRNQNLEINTENVCASFTSFRKESKKIKLDPAKTGKLNETENKENDQESNAETLLNHQSSKQQVENEEHSVLVTDETNNTNQNLEINTENVLSSLASFPKESHNKKLDTTKTKELNEPENTYSNKENETSKTTPNTNGNELKAPDTENPSSDSNVETEQSKEIIKVLRKKRRQKSKLEIIKNYSGFTNVSIAGQDSMSERLGTAEETDEDIPLSVMKQQIESEKLQKDLSPNEVKRKIPKKKLQKEVEEFMSQEDYISNVYGYDVCLTDKSGTRKSTEEEIVSFILNKYITKFKLNSNIIKKLYKEKVQSQPEQSIPSSSRVSQTLNPNVVEKLYAKEPESIPIASSTVTETDPQPETPTRRHAVLTKIKVENILAEGENVNKSSRGDNIQRTGRRRKQSVVAEVFNENITPEDVSSSEDESRSEETFEKVKNLSITIPWQIPRLHLIEVFVTRTPIRKEQQQINDLNIELRKGTFSKAEDNQIKKNWRNFCKLHELPLNPTPFISSKSSLSNTQRLNFTRFLAHGLENRLLHSVYRRFQRLFLKRKSGRFSVEEDKIIIDYMRTAESSAPFSDLGQILNRDKLAIEKRYILLKTKYRNNRVKWSKKRIAEFLNCLLEITECDRVESLKTREIKDVEWLELSRKLKIPRNNLRRVWLRTIYPRLFIKCSVTSKRIKRSLLDLFSENNEHDWKNVNWNRIADNFDGFTGAKLYSLFRNMVDYHVPLAKQANLQECLEYLQNLDVANFLYPGKKVKKIKVVRIQLN